MSRNFFGSKFSYNDDFLDDDSQRINRNSRSGATPFRELKEEQIELLNTIRRNENIEKFMFGDIFVDLNFEDLYQQTPLYVAVEKSHEQALRYLKQMGLSVNDGGSCNRTPIYCTIEKSNVKFLKILLELGAEIQGEDVRVAAHFNRKEMLCALVAEGGKTGDLESRPIAEPGFDYQSVIAQGKVIYQHNKSNENWIKQSISKILRGDHDLVSNGHNNDEISHYVHSFFANNAGVLFSVFNAVSAKHAQIKALLKEYKDAVLNKIDSQELGVTTPFYQSLKKLGTIADRSIMFHAIEESEPGLIIKLLEEGVKLQQEDIKAALKNRNFPRTQTLDIDIILSQQSMAALFDERDLDDMSSHHRQMILEGEERYCQNKKNEEIIKQTISGILTSNFDLTHNLRTASPFSAIYSEDVLRSIGSFLSDDMASISKILNPSSAKYERTTELLKDYQETVLKQVESGEMTVTKRFAHILKQMNHRIETNTMSHHQFSQAEEISDESILATRHAIENQLRVEEESDRQESDRQESDNTISHIELEPSATDDDLIFTSYFTQMSQSSSSSSLPTPQSSPSATSVKSHTANQNGLKK